MSSRFLCIHGHFYQPPRDQPDSGEIPVEAGAFPYPNWNERIYAECYRPNAELGNFSRISYNIGPTLCAWMGTNHSDTLQEIISQDRQNIRQFGVGNAIAQPYNHTILPLSSYHDKVTQVAWGIADFQYHFGRKPTGMWLSETAMDMQTLCVLADHDIKFTILAPWQAKKKKLDVTEPYIVHLPNDRRMTIFFYHAGLSGGVSFNPALTENADRFVLQELSGQFSAEKMELDIPQLILVATDGELYGHHQPLRDHFLAHLLNHASQTAGITPTFPALWLKSHVPYRTVELIENTSWSCHHGVERWRGRCACTPTNGNWKRKLRYAFDRLALSLDEIYRQQVEGYIADAWALRNEYISVMLRQRRVEDLVWEKAGLRLASETTSRLHLLLESQRERQRIYASDAWFFDDFDRIEPRNAIIYAAQAARLTYQATGIDLSGGLVKDLSKVASHRSGLKGDEVFLKYWNLP